MDMSFQKILAQNLEVSTVPLTQTHKTAMPSSTTPYAQKQVHRTYTQTS